MNKLLRLDLLRNQKCVDLRADFLSDKAIFVRISVDI